MVDEDDEEITTIHAGELVLARAGTRPVVPGPPGPSRPESTVRLGAPRKVEPREETVLLQGDAPGPETRPLRPSDQFGWGTVVLPGGGHPAHVADRTQLLAVDDPEEDAAAITATRRSSGAPDPIDAVDTTTLPGIGRASPAEPSPASPSPFRSLGPGAWTIPRIGLASPPTGPAPTGGHATVPMASAAGRSTAAPTGGHAVVPIARHPPAAPPTDGHPVVPISGGHPVVISGGHPVVISGGHPVVPLTPTGGSPILPRSSPRARARGRAPARTPAATGAHAGLRPAASEDARLAWGFLLGVLITVGIVAMAVALALYLSR